MEGVCVVVTVIGFDSEPTAIVLWLVDGEARFKTVCYDEDEIQKTVKRSEIEGDFYHGYDYLVLRN